jgi:hypothetical protein
MADRRLAHLLHDDWMRPKCSVCAAAREGKIDVPRVEVLLASGARLKPTAARFGINPFALRRHWQEISPSRKNHLKFGTHLAQQALQARVADERLAVVDHLVLVRNTLHKSFALAFQAGDHAAVANLARVIADNVERTARLGGEWFDDAPSTSITNVQILNVPGVANVLSGITRALASHPEAREAVIQYLRTANGGAVALPSPEPDVIDVVAAE